MRGVIGSVIAGLALSLGIGIAQAETLTVPVYKLTPQGTGAHLGTIELRDTEFGLLALPDLDGLAPGKHGFHVHEHADCGIGKKDDKIVPGLAAGGHFDPSGTGRHEGPIGDGHLGDLPALVVNNQGRATLPVVAPRVEVPDVVEHALIIHAHGDNYSDNPRPLGGGGPRVACGIVDFGE